MCRRERVKEGRCQFCSNYEDDDNYNSAFAHTAAEKLIIVVLLNSNYQWRMFRVLTVIFSHLKLTPKSKVPLGQSKCCWTQSAATHILFVLNLLYSVSTLITTVNVRAEHCYAPIPFPTKQNTLDKK